MKHEEKLLREKLQILLNQISSFEMSGLNVWESDVLKAWKHEATELKNSAVTHPSDCVKCQILNGTYVEKNPPLNEKENDAMNEDLKVLFNQKWSNSLITSGNANTAKVATSPYVEATNFVIGMLERDEEFSSLPDAVQTQIIVQTMTNVLRTVYNWREV
jgi:hypothetical protein